MSTLCRSSARFGALSISNRGGTGASNRTSKDQTRAKSRIGAWITRFDPDLSVPPHCVDKRTAFTATNASG
jgi:hypothetical protein